LKKYLLLLLTSIAFGQNPFSYEKAGNTLAVKGIAYFNILEGGYGGIIGLEEGFFKNHSIGIKYSYDLATPHQEDTEENGYESINYSHNKNLSFILEYKYYFNFKFLAKTDVSPYVSLSYKNGKKTLENDKDYVHSFYFREIKYSYIGPGLGTIFVLDDSRRWTMDTQITYLLGKKDVFTEDAIPANTAYDTDKFRFEILIAYNINW
jgi:hypothetical protein